MSSGIREPAASPCGSCPYRLDVPSGVWDAAEYEKLPEFDRPTGEQPPSVFMCHQQDGRLCAGWAAVHDMEESLGLRIAAAAGMLDPAAWEATLDYETPVPLFASGADAAAHGLRDLERPGAPARRMVDRLARKGAAGV